MLMQKMTLLHWESKQERWKKELQTFDLNPYLSKISQVLTYSLVFVQLFWIFVEVCFLFIPYTPIIQLNGIFTLHNLSELSYTIP